MLFFWFALKQEQDLIQLPATFRRAEVRRHRRFYVYFCFTFLCSNIMLAAYALQQTLIAATTIVPRSQSGAPGE